MRAPPATGRDRGAGAGHRCRPESSHIAWLEALPGLRTERQRYLQRFVVVARLADHAGRTDTALPLLAELDAATQKMPLVRWEPVLAFEVKHQLIKALDGHERPQGRGQGGARPPYRSAPGRTDCAGPGAALTL